MKIINDTNIDPNAYTNAETLSIFCVDTISTDEAFLTLIKEAFEEDTTSVFRDYGEVLRGIHNRLISEGYIFSDGKFCKKDGKI